MRRLTRAAITAMVLIAPCLVAASPSSIGVFFDVNATDCDATIPYASFFEVYIVALPGTDAANGGMMGAEFRLDGIDPSWFPQVTPSPLANLAVGNLFNSVNITFTTCQGPAPVLLYTVRCIMATQPAPRTFHIERAINGTSLAPVLALCDPPVYTKIWVTGGQAFLNGGTCTVGIEAGTWSAVKSMFK